MDEEKIVTEDASNTTAQPTPAGPDTTQAAVPTEATTDSALTVTQVEETASTTEPAHHDDTDVQAALQRDTQDGRGEGELPESDFQSFATDDVEKNEEGS